MQFDDLQSGDHLERWLNQPPAVVANILLFGTAGAVLAFAIILVSYLD
jgi:hypothetical protein